MSSYTQPSKHDNSKIELEVSKENSKRKNLKGKISKENSKEKSKKKKFELGKRKQADES